MAAYADESDFDRFGLPVASVGDADVGAALLAASALADSYFAAETSRVTLPLTDPFPEAVKRAVCIIAAYDVMSRRGYNPDGDAGQLRMRYEDQIRWLEGIAAGTVTPVVTPPEDPGTNPGTGLPLDGFFVVSASSPRGW